MIVTLTPNPSVDHTVDLDELIRGAVHRVQASRLDAGGKGVNVARALAAHSIEVRAVLPTGGLTGEAIGGLMRADGVTAVPVPVAGALRMNISVVEPGGVVTKINELGPELSPAETAELRAQAIATAVGSPHPVDGGLHPRSGAPAAWLVCCGSLPRGIPAGFYADIVTALRGTGVAVAVDSSGPALRAAVAAGPDLVKPNADELAEVTGMPVGTLGEAAAAGQELVRRGARRVLASLGPDGALFMDGRTVVHGEAPVELPVSTVGAGDALLAGYLAACGTALANGPGPDAAGPAAWHPDAIAEALAWGAAAVALPGSRMPRPCDLDRAAVTMHDRLDAARPLKP
ncbi:hypothetical protein BBK14_28650 [Parafrankia soli]|uniref:Carbohydrate kinase PfkB domain-containing protein n=1 Tax=Parafrankia soli TaxID=2599596 RepID=A0A1S1PEU1_9ACTN|nr:1-phosphofructokinase family hexose kinase [Parafrankia soli]OHV19767.1 hypothetical protein BBK14_28650 [Parafrankia soli]